MEFTGEHLAKIVETEQRCKSNTKRIDEITRKQEDLESLTKSVCLIANEQEHMRNDIKETKDDVKEIKRVVTVNSHESDKVNEIREEVEDLKLKPARRWDDLIKVIISGIIGAIITYIAVQLGLK